MGGLYVCLMVSGLDNTSVFFFVEGITKMLMKMISRDFFLLPAACTLIDGDPWEVFHEEDSFLLLII